MGRPARPGPEVWRWQATHPRSAVGYGGGSTSRQMSMTNGQRVLNRQPDGGFTGLGMSPVRTMRVRVRSTRGLGTGTADMRASV
jgi:hypothetical protein